MESTRKAGGPTYLLEMRGHLSGWQQRHLLREPDRSKPDRRRLEVDPPPTADWPALQEGPGLSGYRVKTRWGSEPWVAG